MKKVFFAIFSAFLLMPFLSNSTHAGDCSLDETKKGIQIQATTGVNVRDFCEGEKIGTVNQGQVFTVEATADFDLFYVIKFENGALGYVWHEFFEELEGNVNATNTFNPSEPENPETEEPTTEEPTPTPIAEEPVEYNPPSEPDPNVPLWDVPTHKYEDAIYYLYNHPKRVVRGNDTDNSYGPNKAMNRAEFGALMARAGEDTDPSSDEYNNCFDDVTDQWFAGAYCLLNQKGVIQGYPDGLGWPGNDINLAEASAMTVRYFQLATPEVPEDAIWYQEYILAMQNANLIPNDFYTFDQKVTKGQFAEILFRILEGTEGKTTTNFEFAASPSEPEPTEEEPVTEEPTEEEPTEEEPVEEPVEEPTEEEPVTEEPVVSEDAICVEDVLALEDVTGAVMVGDEDSLRSALILGGTVQLTNNIDATAPFDVMADTVLDLNGFELNGQNSTHLLVVREVNNFTVQNGTLKNANNQMADTEHFSWRSGAALMVRGFTADGQPGVGNIQVIEVDFENNQTKATGPGDIRGGAAYFFNVPNVTISGSTFMNNVGSNGGAIGGLGSSIKVVDSYFEGNETNGPGPSGTLEGHGGAISLDAVSQNKTTAYFHVCGSTFKDNMALNGGGAIFAVMHQDTGTQVTIDRSYFTGNMSTSTSEGQGGAIYMQDDSNHAPAGGGANTFALTNSTLEGNESWQQGGGAWILWTNPSVTQVTNNTFVDNKTNNPDLGMGGGLVLTEGDFSVVGNTFANNYAYFHGAGIQASGSISLNAFDNNYFENNPCDRPWGMCNTNATFSVGSNNMQFMADGFIQDTNSNAPVSPGATILNDPQLLPLADNGGAVPTMAFIEGSAAASAGVGAVAVE